MYFDMKTKKFYLNKLILLMCYLMVIPCCWLKKFLNDLWFVFQSNELAGLMKQGFKYNNEVSASGWGQMWVYYMLISVYCVLAIYHTA